MLQPSVKVGRNLLARAPNLPIEEERFTTTPQHLKMPPHAGLVYFGNPGAQAEQEVRHVPRRLQPAEPGIAGVRCRTPVLFGWTAKPLDGG